MKAIVVTDRAAEAAGITLAERPEPTPAINDVVVEVHASGFVPAEWEWPSTWVDRSGHDRAPAIIGHEFAGVVTSLGYGTTGLSLGQRVFGITDWHRDGTLAEYAAVEARNLAPLPGDVDFTVGASLPMRGLTAWQGLFEHGRFQAGQSLLVHGAAGSVGFKAATASSRVETLPMFVRSRPSRTRWTIVARDLAGGFKIPRSQPKRDSCLDLACFAQALLERDHTRRHPGG